MKKILGALVCSLFFVFFVFNLQNNGHLSFAKEGSEKWKAKMGSFAGLLTELLKDISLQEKSYEIERAKKIEKNAARLSEMAHKVKSEEMADFDPSLEFVSTLFSDEMNRGFQALSAGHAQYSYRIFKGASKYCIACHTRTESAPLYFGDLSALTVGMSPFEKAEFLGALQQFDQSLVSYQEIIKNNDHARYFQVEWERALKRALMVAIRVKEDPKLARSIILLAEKNKSVPKSFQSLFSEWKKSIQQWTKEKSKKDITAQEYFDHAIRLLKAAEDKKEYIYDPKALIDLLRASSYLHATLKLSPGLSGEALPQALYSLGFIYETLGDLELWNLHELYYETCMRRFSNTHWSEKCFERYSDSIIAGYSGSSGTHLPRDVRSKLNTLKKLSVKKAAPKK